MSFAAFSALRQLVYSRLSTNAALLAAVTGVFTDLRPGQAFPYITLDYEAADARTKTDTSLEVRLTLHVWTRQQSHKQTYEILALAAAALEGLTADAGGLVGYERLQDTRVLTEPDQTDHGLMVWRFILN